MATATYYQRGEAIDYVNSGESKIDAGAIVPFGSRLAVAACDIPAGAIGSVFVEGVFEMPKEYAASDKDITAGQEVYWDNESNCIKAAAESSPVNGFAVAAASSTAETVLVKINA